MPENPLSAVARYVRIGRSGAQLSVDEAARLIGISPVTWGRVEKGLPVRAVTYRGIERALGWAPGSVEAIEAGGEPTVADEPPTAPRGQADDPLLRGILDSTHLSSDDRAYLVWLVLNDRRESSRGTDQVEEQERPGRRKGA